MNKSKIYAFLLALSVLFIFSCREELNDPQTIPQEVEIPEDNITSSVYGKITDENNVAVENATVFIGTNSTSTDEDGFFHFNDIAMDGYGTLIKIEKDGYFDGLKMIEPNVSARSYVACRLIPKALTGTIPATSGGQVSTNGNASITFDANSFIDEAGAPYSGDVKVYAKWLDPLSPETQLEMPGDLRAVDQSSDIVMLATFGMLAVELEGANNESLNLGTDQTAELSFPVPTDLQSAAPSTIPLWSFNETLGYWIEEGSATLVNGFYIGEVSHFSFWNCDVPYPLINLDGSLQDNMGNPLSDYRISINVVGGGSSRSSYTDSDGNFGGKVPADVELRYTIYDQCNIVIISQTMGPFSTDVTLTPIILSVSSSSTMIEGNLTNCLDLPVTNGYVKIIAGGTSSHILYTDATGAFSKVINTCSATNLEYQGVDLDQLKQSAYESAAITGMPIDLGTVKACDLEVDDYFFYEVNGKSTILDTAYAQIVSDIGGVVTYALSGSQSQISGFPTIQIAVDNGIGTYNPIYVLFFDQDDQNLTSSCSPCDDFTITFTELSTISGEIIEADFSGTLVINGAPVFGEGSFRAILD